LHECIHDKEESIRLDDDYNLPPRTPRYSDDHDMFYEMVSNMAIPPLSEIFNTYGEGLANAQLLNQYGFILDVNDNDRLFWTMEEVLRLVLPDDFMEINNRNMTHQLAETSTLLQDANLGPVLSESNLVYWEDNNDKNLLSINGEGALSQGLWILLFTLSIQHYPLIPRGDLELVLSSVIKLLIQFESMGGDDYSDDAFSTDETGIMNMGILLRIAAMAVNLCKDRKLRSGKAGSENVDLSNAMEVRMCF